MEPKSENTPSTEVKVRYIDLPELSETFADSINSLLFDGQTLRIELGVSRVDEMKAGAPISVRRYPACRLVLTPAVAVELINRMQQVASALTRAGVIKPTTTDPTPPSPDAPGR